MNRKVYLSGCGSEVLERLNKMLANQGNVGFGCNESMNLEGIVLIHKKKDTAIFIDAECLNSDGIYSEIEKTKEALEEFNKSVKGLKEVQEVLFERPKSKYHK